MSADDKPSGVGIVLVPIVSVGLGICVFIASYDGGKGRLDDSIAAAFWAGLITFVLFGALVVGGPGPKEVRFEKDVANQRYRNAVRREARDRDQKAADADRRAERRRTWGY